MIAVKCSMPNIPRFETVKVPPDSSGGVIVSVAHLLGQRAGVAGDLPERLAVGVEDGRHHERVLRRDRDPDVHARVELEVAVAVGAVDARVLAQRGGAQALTTMSLKDGAGSRRPPSAARAARRRASCRRSAR